MTTAELADNVLHDMWRAMQDVGEPGALRASLAVVSAFHQVGVLTAAQVTLWNFRLGCCPGHAPGRAWCSYCDAIADSV